MDLWRGMPIYEFYSPDTNKIYSFFARRLLKPGEVPRCPDGREKRMEKMLSRFAVTGRAKEKTDAPGGEDFDPRQEAQMMEIAREMESMGDENPDPRQVGKLMRKMTEIAGERMPEQVEEMVRRLEAGEDPEKLEEEFGDTLDETMDDFSSDSKEGAARRAKGSRPAPQRDPALYELSDYLS